MIDLSILLLTLLAAFFGTTTGFGTSTIMVSVLAIWFPLPEVLLFVGVIHWFGDIWKIYFFKKGINWKLILLFGIPGILASYLGAYLPISLEPNMLKKFLAIFLLLYTILIFYKPHWKISDSNRNALLGGSLSGFFAGIFGIGGAIRGAFLNAYNLPKSIYIFTSGMIGLFIDTSRLAGYYQSGTKLNNLDFSLLYLAIPVSLLGAYFAKRIVDKISQRHFRYVVGFGLLIIAMLLLVN